MDLKLHQVLTTSKHFVKQVCRNSFHKAFYSNHATSTYTHVFKCLHIYLYVGGGWGILPIVCCLIVCVVLSCRGRVLVLSCWFSCMCVRAVDLKVCLHYGIFGGVSVSCSFHRLLGNLWRGFLMRNLSTVAVLSNLLLYCVLFRSGCVFARK